VGATREWVTRIVSEKKKGRKGVQGRKEEKEDKKPKKKEKRALEVSEGEKGVGQHQPPKMLSKSAQL